MPTSILWNTLWLWVIKGRTERKREEGPSDRRLMENPFDKHRSRIKGLSHSGG